MRPHFLEENEKERGTQIMSKQTQVVGYLPDEKPSAWRLFLYALQQVIVMFPPPSLWR